MSRKSTRKTKHILLPKDYIRYRMTGEYATEVSDASGTLLLDVVNRTWSDKLLGLLRNRQSPAAALARIAGGHRHAPQQKARRRWACTQASPVVGGGGRSGRRRGRQWHRHRRHRQRHARHQRRRLRPQRSARRAIRKGRVHTMCHAVPGKWCVFGCMLSAGGSFQWLRNQLGAGGSRRREEEESRSVRTARRRAPSKRPPGSRRTLLPPLSHRRALPASRPQSPAADGSASPARTTRDMLIRSLLEGVTFGMRDALEIMRQMNIPITQIRASGGGARSDFWRQLQADIYNRPIVLTNAAEGPAYGVALLAGVGTGVWSSVEEACKACIKQTEKIQPKQNPPRFTIGIMASTQSSILI